MKLPTGKMLLGLSLPLAAGLGYILYPRKRKALPENSIALDLNVPVADFFIDEENFADQMEHTVMPYLEERKQAGFLESGSAKLYYECYRAENSKGHVVIIHGFTSGVHEYREIAYYFLKNGYSVDMMDHRGHGFSSREVEDLCKVTVSSFDVYVEDLKAFLDTVVKPSLTEGEKLFAFAHSMGGGVTELLLEREPETFAAAVLTGPMVQIEFGKIPIKLADAIVKLAKQAGSAQEYILGYGAYDGVYDFEGSNYDSEPRYRYMYDLLEKEPRYRTNGGTYAWLAAAMTASDEIRSNARNYVTPTLLFQPQKDTMASASAQNEFVKNASNITLVTVDGAKHNLPFAGSGVLSPFFCKVLDFFNGFQENSPEQS